ncbi:unnamed protein product [Bursaphelenchus xylophilus]|uniref:(pine wood nematode) hypothetical protein n=1 Tax=Bursaphelenchus xylophilus TaxID=6326 RepID=A0A1I7RW02_BURXY|nr:unnamed protein product [Bursaphelenchus xylophilus]CAG9094950.1 unnamed protein product [Bursaphelenchus xylophilus]
MIIAALVGWSVYWFTHKQFTFNGFSLVRREQSVAVQGMFWCDEKQASGVKVKLYDSDRLGVDDLLDEGFTNLTGQFFLSGHTKEFSAIEPKLNIYHRCGRRFGVCKQKITIHIPDEFICNGETCAKVFDIGTLNLNAKYSGQRRDCLN